MNRVDTDLDSERNSFRLIPDTIHRVAYNLTNACRRGVSEMSSHLLRQELLT